MTTPVPDWLTAELFVSVLKKNVENFEKIQKFSATPAFAAGENYLSVLWSIEIEAVVKGKLLICLVKNIFSLCRILFILDDDTSPK